MMDGTVGTVRAVGTVETVGTDGTNGNGQVGVLLVDDQPANLVALEAMLQGLGQRLVTASSGREALKRLLDEDFAVILLDVKMPEMDGYETMRAIREQAAFRQLPIIAVTAKAMKGDREKCIEAGASDYIAKPVDMDQLLTLLRVWLYR